MEPDYGGPWYREGIRYRRFVSDGTVGMSLIRRLPRNRFLNDPNNKIFLGRL